MQNSVNRANSSNPSWMLKKMNDYRSELENLPGSYNCRIPKQEVSSTKNSNFRNRNLMTSAELGYMTSQNKTISKKFPSENEKTCVITHKKLRF